MAGASEAIQGRDSLAERFNSHPVAAVVRSRSRDLRGELGAAGRCAVMGAGVRIEVTPAFRRCCLPVVGRWEGSGEGRRFPSTETRQEECGYE